MQRAELDALTVTEIHAHREAWMDKRRREEDLAARQAMFIAAKVWDTKGEVSAEGLFPILGQAAPLTPEEASKREWDKLRAIFANLPKGPDGKDRYAVDRTDPG